MFSFPRCYLRLPLLLVHPCRIRVGFMPWPTRQRFGRIPTQPHLPKARHRPSQQENLPYTRGCCREDNTGTILTATPLCRTEPPRVFSRHPEHCSELQRVGHANSLSGPNLKVCGHADRRDITTPRRPQWRGHKCGPQRRPPPLANSSWDNVVPVWDLTLKPGTNFPCVMQRGPTVLLSLETIFLLPQA